MPEFYTKTARVWTLQNSLDEEVEGADFTEDSGLPAVYTSYQRYDLLTNGLKTCYGLTFDADNSFSAPSPTPSASRHEMTISFWYYSPGVLGFTKHALTRRNQPKIAPIIGQATPGIVTGGFSTLQNVFFLLYEVGYSDAENVIQFEYASVQGAGVDQGTPNYRVVSEPFRPGLHYVLATLCSVDGHFKLRVDIDGKAGNEYWFTATAPSGDCTAVNVCLNYLYSGFTAHLQKQSGAYISDIVMRTEFAQDDSKGYIFGWEAISKDDLHDNDYQFLGIAYDQPSTITTNQIWAEGGNIYVARSNGEILRGVRPIWDTERQFPDQNSDGRMNGTTVRI